VSNSTEAGTSSAGRTVLTVLAWLWVVLPFLYGVYALSLKLPALF
jgi:hypothetical protein